MLVLGTGLKLFVREQALSLAVNPKTGQHERLMGAASHSLRGLL